MFKKKFTLGIVTAGAIVLALAGIGNSTIQSSKQNSNPSVKSAITEDVSKAIINVKPLTCNGGTVMANCTLDGVNYKTYQYHAAVPEKSHTEQVTTYEKKVTGYCTLCSDGTYSPSCATGRGACSWHGGVAQWNAPRYSSIPVYSTKTVIDAPAIAEYYEKVVE
jgi:hypothetical protein